MKGFSRPEYNMRDVLFKVSWYHGHEWLWLVTVLVPPAYCNRATIFLTAPYLSSTFSHACRSSLFSFKKKKVLTRDHDKFDPNPKAVRLRQTNSTCILCGIEYIIFFITLQQTHCSSSKRLWDWLVMLNIAQYNLLK